MLHSPVEDEKSHGRRGKLLPTKCDCYKGESDLKPYEDAMRFILTLPLVASLWLIGDAVAISQLSDEITPYPCVDPCPQH